MSRSRPLLTHQRDMVKKPKKLRYIKVVDFSAKKLRIWRIVYLNNSFIIKYIQRTIVSYITQLISCINYKNQNEDY